METVEKKALPSKRVNQGVCSLAARSRELYPTPRPLTEAIIRTGELPHALIEPACGRGDMAEVLMRHGYKVTCSDIEDYGWAGQDFQSDFFDIQKTDADAIVSNPPFSLSGRFVRHGLQLCPKVVILNRLAFLEGRARRDIIDGHLSRIYPIVERPPMMHRHTQDLDGIWREWAGKKSSSAMPVAIFVFERDHNPATGTVLRRISWRERRDKKGSDSQTQ